MSWIRPSAGRGDALADVPLPSDPPPPAEHPTAGLKHVFARLRRPGASVLDLGPALAANVAFFNPFGARLRIADLDAAIDEAHARDVPLPVWERNLDRLLPLRDDERFDLVLAWDLPNYVGREQWSAFARRLTPRIAPGGALHLLARVGTNMPARPCHYRILSADVLSEDALLAETVPAPRLPHAEVERLHPGLVAPRSHLGKHGVQEYVLEPAAEHDLPPRRVAQPRQRSRPRPA